MRKKHSVFVAIAIVLTMVFSGLSIAQIFGDDAETGELTASVEARKRMYDLVVSDIWWVDMWGTTTSTITSGQPYTVCAKITNLYYAVPAFNTLLTIDGTTVSSKSTSSMLAGVSIDLSWTNVLTSTVSLHTATVTVDSTNLIPETNSLGTAETNNVRTEYFTVRSAEWTFAVYLDGDNSIENEGILDFLEMAELGSTVLINIVVMFDRIPGYDSTYGDWTGTERFFVTQGTQPYTTNAYEHCGELNMGDVNVFVDFANDAFDRFKSSKQSLVVWDHGGGWVDGVCIDGTSAGDYLTTDELRGGLVSIRSHIGKNIDVLSFDACLMGMIEIMKVCEGTVTEFVGSEEYIEWQGFPYDAIIEELRAAPTMTSLTLAERMVLEYHDFYYTLIGYQYSTLAAFHLSSVFTGVTGDLDAFANLLTSKLSTYKTQITAARQATDEFIYPYYADLFEFARQVEISVSDTSVQTAAQNLMDAISLATIEEWSGNNHLMCWGMSIYWPETDYLASYDTQLLSLSGTWDDFLRAYFAVSPPTYLEDFEEGATSISDWTKTTAGTGVVAVVADPASASAYSLHIAGGGLNLARATSPYLTAWNSLTDYTVTMNLYVVNPKALVVYDDSRIIVAMTFMSDPVTGLATPTLIVVEDGLEVPLYYGVTMSQWHTITIFAHPSTAQYLVSFDGADLGGYHMSSGVPVEYHTFSMGGEVVPGSKDAWDAYWDNIRIEQ